MPLQLRAPAFLFRNKSSSIFIFALRSLLAPSVSFSLAQFYSTEVTVLPQTVSNFVRDFLGEHAVKNSFFAVAPACPSPALPRVPARGAYLATPLSHFAAFREARLGSKVFFPICFFLLYFAARSTLIILSK